MTNTTFEDMRPVSVPRRPMPVTRQHTPLAALQPHASAADRLADISRDRKPITFDSAL